MLQNLRLRHRKELSFPAGVCIQKLPSCVPILTSSQIKQATKIYRQTPQLHFDLTSFCASLNLSAAVFPRFLELPKELQIKIWKHATSSAWKKSWLSIIEFRKSTTIADYVPCLGGPYSGKIIYIKGASYLPRHANCFKSGLLDSLQACSLSRIAALEWIKQTVEEEIRHFESPPYMKAIVEALSEVLSELIEQMHKGSKA